MKLLPKDMSPYQGAYYPELDPAVIIDANGLYPALREEIYDHVKKSKSLRSGVYQGLTEEKFDDYFRSSSSCIVSQEIINKARSRLEFVLKWQLAQLPNQRDYVLSEALQFLKYDEKNNGKFLAHTDNAYFDANGKFLYTSPKRVLSTVTYINDDFEGGELVLRDIVTDDGPLVYRPKAGETVIFPSDIRYTHEVLPVTKGVRYCIVGWFGLA